MMKPYKWFILFFIITSCSLNTVQSSYHLSRNQKESVWFDIYEAKGYFYNGEGFIMVKCYEDNKTVMLKCTLDTVFTHERRVNRK